MRYLTRSHLHTIEAVLIAVMVLSLASCAQTRETEVTTGPGATDTTTISSSSATDIPAKGLTNWTITKDIPRGYAGPPGEQFFISMVEPKRVDSKGAELWVHMNPVVDPSCQQQFRVGWEFERDVSMLLEGDTINVTVFNEPSGDPQGGLRECYIQAKTTMIYGGEVIIELKASGQSHFLYQEGYQHYHQGSSQYLFAVPDPTGMVYPVEPNTPARSSTGTILVMDGAHEIGEMDAPHGNFSFTISAGSVFTYTVTYLYDAITE
jgi:hypothetical protein